MMRQYLEIRDGVRRDYKDALLFYRMGDFYELFFEDAEIAARELDITLTKRGKHDGGEIPMAGVPWHQSEPYLHKLIAAGHVVAVCEQSETPAEAKKRGGHKAVVNRDVVRLVTPGTLTEEALLDTRTNNYLAAIARAKGSFAVAWMDMSTGEFYTQPVEDSGLGTVLSRLQASEVLIADEVLADASLQRNLSEFRKILKPQPAPLFNSMNGAQRLQTLYNVSSLGGLGDFSKAEVAAAGALVNYVELTQKGKLPQIQNLSQVKAASVMEIDGATLRNLEILKTQNGTRKGSLLETIDRTVTAGGGRLLTRWLSAPLTDPGAIKGRHTTVAALMDQPDFLREVRTILQACPDLERSLSRITLDRASPRDLAAIRDGLKTTQALKNLARTHAPAGEELNTLIDTLGFHAEMIDLLERALKTDLPLLARDGNFVKKGYSAELDEFQDLRDNSKKLIAALQGKYARQSNVANLKIKHNNVLGYFVEVSPKQADNMNTPPEGLEASPFIHRQTLASAVRFSTTELAEIEQKMTKAADRALGIEMEIFKDLTARIVNHATATQHTAGVLATLDVLASFAVLARDEDYVRPTIDDTKTFVIEQGRHPVVEAALKREAVTFISNDADLSGHGSLWLLTGPNMAGKSTFLRQNALIAVLAQAGCFVPAKSAHIGIIDKLFSRVGAADDLARGRSTFMVEMIETAAILNQATAKSLVILDEIGRGTATFDGLSIAWATLEHLHNTSHCRGLFATHYHELTQLCETLKSLTCHTMKVKDVNGKIVFLHEVEAGTADRSYGIHVAELAGLPAPVITRAEQILQTLESSKTSQSEPLPLFQTPLDTPEVEAPKPAPIWEELHTKLATLNPDQLTPKQALDTLYQLKEALLNDDSNQS